MVPCSDCRGVSVEPVVTLIGASDGFSYGDRNPSGPDGAPGINAASTGATGRGGGVTTAGCAVLVAGTCPFSGTRRVANAPPANAAPLASICRRETFCDGFEVGSSESFKKGLGEISEWSGRWAELARVCALGPFVAIAAAHSLPDGRNACCTASQPEPRLRANHIPWRADRGAADC